ncbi:MAG: hypothetical protein ACTJG4_15600, partial [Vreelandella alkaliphila]
QVSGLEVLPGAGLTDSGLLLTCVVAPDSSLGSNAATASYYSTFDSIGLFNYNTTLFNNDSPPKVRENYFQSTAFNSSYP